MSLYLPGTAGSHGRDPTEISNKDVNAGVNSSFPTEEIDPTANSELVETDILEDAQVSSKKVQKGPSRRCRHWARGLCKLNANCTFLHSGVAGVHVPCRHFARTGSCSRGDLCDFKHETNFGYGPFVVGYPGSPSNGSLRPTQYIPMYAPSPHLLPQSAIQRLSTVANLNAAVNNAAANFAALNIHVRPLGPSRSDVLVPVLTAPMTPTSSSRCRHWESGSCRLGKTCGFLHDPNVPQKYRTKVCRHWEKGNCRLNESCSFAHSSCP
jgi:hypothetical protein